MALTAPLAKNGFRMREGWRMTFSSALTQAGVSSLGSKMERKLSTQYFRYCGLGSRLLQRWVAMK